MGDPPEGSAKVYGSDVRYVEAVLKDGDLHLYYEYARADGAHELRRLVVRATHRGTAVPEASGILPAR